MIAEAVSPNAPRPLESPNITNSKFMISEIDTTPLERFASDWMYSSGIRVSEEFKGFAVFPMYPSSLLWMTPIVVPPNRLLRSRPRTYIRQGTLRTVYRRYICQGPPALRFDSEEYFLCPVIWKGASKSHRRASIPWQRTLTFRFNPWTTCSICVEGSLCQIHIRKWDGGLYFLTNARRGEEYPYHFDKNSGTRCVWDPPYTCCGRHRRYHGIIPAVLSPFLRYIGLLMKLMLHG
jgi:hypothetical protein